jgi:hypothetical protein
MQEFPTHPLRSRKVRNRQTRQNVKLEALNLNSIKSSCDNASKVLYNDQLHITNKFDIFMLNETLGTTHTQLRKHYKAARTFCIPFVSDHPIEKTI